MAVFLGASARIWSRYKLRDPQSNGGFSASLWGEYTGSTLTVDYPKYLQCSVNADCTKIAYHINHTYYVPVINKSVAYSLSEVPYGTYVLRDSAYSGTNWAPYCWWVTGNTDDGNTGKTTSNVPELTGLTKTNTAYPEWELATKPPAFGAIPWRWVGEWSDDESVFASVLVEPSTGNLYLSARKANDVTLSLRTPLGVVHQTVLASFYGNTERSGTLPRVIVRSETDIWVFHTEHNVANYSNPSGVLKLSVWNGTTVSTTTLLTLTSTTAFTSFDVVRGADGYMYVTYTLYDSADPISDYDVPPAVNGKIYLRTLQESSKSLSSAVSAPWAYNSGDYKYAGVYSHGRINSNRVFPFRGVNYIVVESNYRIAVFTYLSAAPSSVSLLRSGFLPKYAATDWYGQTWGRWPSSCSNFVAIEYDPETDMAYLVVVYPSAIAELRPYDGTPPYDTTIIRVVAHYQKLADTSWNMQTTLLSEIPAYPKDSSTSYTNRSKYLDSIGYIPSRQGSSKTGTLLLAYVSSDYPGSTYQSRWHEIVKVQFWSAPKFVDGPVSEIDASADMLAVGTRDFRQDMLIDAAPTINVIGLLRRKSLWGTYYEKSNTEYVDGAAYIDLTPLVSVFGNLTENHVHSVIIDVQADMYVSAEITTSTFLSYRYFSIGTSEVSSFIGELNVARAAAGVEVITTSPPDDRLLDSVANDDVAQKHTEYEVLSRRFAHGSMDFPVAYSTANKRISRVSYDGEEGIALVLAPVEYGSSDVSGTFHSALEQMLNDADYGALLLRGFANTADVRLHIAYSVGKHPTTRGGGEPFDKWPTTNYTPEVYNKPENLSVYITCLLFVPKGITVDTLFTYSWETEALGIRLLEYSWESMSMVRAKQVHELNYSTSIEVLHKTSYAYVVSAMHIAENTNSVGSIFEIDFTNSGSVNVSHSSPYAIDVLRAAAGHSLSWSQTIVAGHAADYGEAYRVRAELTALYGVPIALSANHLVEYVLMQRTRRLHVAPMLLGPKVTTSQSSMYEMLARNVVVQSFSAAYELMPTGAGATFLSPQSVATMNGMSIELDDCYISCDYDSVGYTFECKVSDLEFVRGAHIGDRIDVLFEGTAYLFFLSNVSSDSPERSAAESVSIRGLSPVFLLDAPYAETVTYAPDEAKLFSEIIQEALGVPVDFSRHIDWVVPYGRAQSSSQTPLGLVSGFLGSIGSRLLSNPDGSVYALPRYPVGFDTVPTGVPPHALDETNHVFTKGSTYEYNKGYNRFRVRDSEEGYGDIIEYDEPTSIASVWLSPYRSSGWELRCTASDIVLYSQGEVVEEHEEMWGFKAGATSSSYPILDLVSLTWITDSLGGVSFVPYSTKVSAPVGVNFGYGLAKAVYRAKRSKFELVTSTPVEATQLIIVEL